MIIKNYILILAIGIFANIAGPQTILASSQRYQVEGTKDEITKEVKRVFGAGANTALAVLNCESGFNVAAVSRTKDYGLFQINSRTWTRLFGEEFKVNWKENIRVAKVIYDRSGSWNPWASSRKCWGKNG